MKDKEFFPDDRDWPDLRWEYTIHNDIKGHKAASAVCLSGSSDLVLLDRDIAGEAYIAMLDIVRKHIHAFSLVWRDDVSYTAHADSLANQLHPFLCYEHHTNDWRGTTLLESKAWVRWYKVTSESLSLIAEPESLFAWSGSELPEDLAFYTENGKGWLGSTAHEGLCWIEREVIDRTITTSFLKTYCES